MSKIVGLIPAAGSAKRLAPLPCSKEIFPIGSFYNNETNEYYPKPVGLYLIERLKQAGVEKAYVILNKEKIDILKYFGSGNHFSIALSYLVQENSMGMPVALDQAYPWVNDSIVLFGMPDTIFFPEDSFQTLLNEYKKNKADIILGLFPTDTPERFGMVKFDKNNNFIETIDKPLVTNLKYMWGIGCWGPKFTEFLHHFIIHNINSVKELILGDVFQKAVENGLKIQTRAFTDGRYIDIGSKTDLLEIISEFSSRNDFRMSK